MEGQEIGRSCGGLTSKLHGAVDALGDPLRVLLSAGQVSDIEQAPNLIDQFPAQAVITGKGYGAEHFVARAETTGAQALIPPCSNRSSPRQFDSHLYRERNLIERLCARLKQCRRIATGYDKLAKSFLSFIHLVCAFVRLA